MTEKKTHIDVKIKSWGNGSNSGPWVKLDLLDDDDLAFFEKYRGYGFHMFLVPIENEAKEKVPEKPKLTRKRAKKRSNECWETCREPNYWHYLENRFGGTCESEQQAIEVTRDYLEIESRAELDKEVNYASITKYNGLMRDFRNKVNAH